MKIILWYIGCALLLVLLQGAVLSTWIPPGYPRPQLLIPMIVLIAFNAPTLSGLCYGVFLSFLFDLFSGGPWGVWSTIGICTFVIVSIVARQMFVKSIAVVAALSVISTLVAELIGTLMVQGTSALGGDIVFQAIKDAFVTGCISPLFLFFGKSYFLRKRTF